MRNKRSVWILALALFGVPQSQARGSESASPEVSAHPSGRYAATPDIVSTLPKYCWWQYVKNVPWEATEYRIMGCGDYANHYCTGLVHMAQAEKERNLNKALISLHFAKEDMEYTLHWTKDLPECFLRPNAQVNISRINLQMEMLKLKQSKRSR